MMATALLERVRQALAAHQLIPQGARVIVGVSGGADSVALLHVLNRLRSGRAWNLHIVHVDHRLRRESGEDANFVRRLGEEWTIPTTIERFDVRAICAREGWSLEDGARRIRYQCFLEAARRQSASHVALAHTADDQAETVLMRLVRGTGLMGLGAIPMKRQLEEVWVVRPLLSVWRQDILAYLREARVAHREDATNQDPRFVRNRIRHELLPLLERDYNPNIKGTLTQLAEQSRWDYTYLQEAAGRQWKRLAKVKRPGHITIAVSALLRQPKALQRQLVRHAIQRAGGEPGQFEFRHWLEVERLLTQRPAGTLLHLPGGVQLRREPERIVCEPAAPRGASSLDKC